MLDGMRTKRENMVAVIFHAELLISLMINAMSFLETKVNGKNDGVFNYIIL